MSKASDKSAVKKIAVGAALAGAAGYLAGILSAPNSGKKTRKQLKAAADERLGDTEKQLKALHTELGQILEDAKARGDDLSGQAGKKLDSAMGSAAEAKHKLREVLSALHEGESSDKELSGALEDAKRALDHLKVYLKK